MFLKNFRDGSFPSHNIIGPNTTLNGDIQSVGNLRIDGNFTGTINIDGELIVGQTGVVKGTITTKKIDIYGEVNADIKSTEVILRSTSKMTGIIKTDKLIIEDGSIYNGTCNM